MAFYRKQEEGLYLCGCGVQLSLQLLTVTTKDKILVALLRNCTWQMMYMCYARYTREIFTSMNSDSVLEVSATVYIRICRTNKHYDCGYL